MVTTFTCALEPAGGAAGAVYTVSAVPLLLVTRLRAASTPKSCCTPLTAMSTRTEQPTSGAPDASRVVTTIDDCEPPSWLMLSGVADTLIDVAASDGPL